MEQRLTLISDATDEFANNTNNSYKVRIPDGLRLEGKGWHVALLSLTLPNTTTSDNPSIASGKTITKMSYYGIHFKTIVNNEYTVLEALHFTTKVQEQHTPAPLNGVGFWNNIGNAYEANLVSLLLDKAKEKISVNDPTPLIVLKKTMRPSFHWDGEDLVLEKRGVDTTFTNQVSIASFDMALEVAEKWGFARQNTDGKWIAGPNVRLGMDNFTITNDKPPRASSASITGVASLNGKAFEAVKNPDRPKFPQVPQSSTSDYDRLWMFTDRGGEKYIRFSGFWEWHFINLNQTFTNLHRHAGQAVMVYTNLQQSAIVGNTKAQLLRELVIHRGGEAGHSNSEPTHLQWIPVATHQADIVEVQLADVNGNLISLPKGKSLVTVALKQMV